jgi:hypothetical protein
MARALLALLALCLSFTAVAQSYRRPPQDGYWWNSSEGGRGLTIETQGEIIAVTHYVYDSQGRSIFLQTAGTWNANSGELVTGLLGFAGGQCIGCAYTAPTLTNLGNATLRFSSTIAGEIIYPNGTRVAISRYDYGYPAPEDKMLGTWNTAWYGSISEFANFLYLSSRCTTCTTPNTVQGVLERTRSGRPVLAAFQSGIYLILVDSTTSFYELYYMTAEPDRLQGLGCTYAKTSSPPSISSCTGLAEGTRAHSLVHAQSIYGLSKAGREMLANRDVEVARESALRTNKSTPVRVIAAEITDMVSAEALQANAESLQADMEALPLN